MTNAESWQPMPELALWIQSMVTNRHWKLTYTATQGIIIDSYRKKYGDQPTLESGTDTWTVGAGSDSESCYLSQ